MEPVTIKLGKGDNKPYKNRKWLEYHYCTLGKSTCEIGKEFNINQESIHYWLKKLDIPVRTMSEAIQAVRMKEKKAYKNREWLEYQYVTLKKSENEIGAELGISTVHYWLVKLGIPRRSIVEARRLQSNHVILTKQLLEFLDGMLLGDGHLTYQKGWSSSYQHASKPKSYLKWASATLARYGIKQCGRINKHSEWFRSRASGKWYFATYYSYRSPRYVELSELQSRWYRPATEEERKTGRKSFKIVPLDLKLTPLVCRQWYISDGSLGLDSKDGNILLNCESFEVSETNFLVMQLNKLGFIAKRRKDNGIWCSSSSTKAFLKYIGPCPVKCYQYKWKK